MENLNFDLLRQNELEAQKVRIFHGISSSQRSGGQTLKTLENIIDTGVIYPAARGENEDMVLGDIDKLEIAVLKHALKHKIWEGQLDLDQYLEDNSHDSEFLSDPAVKKYMDDDNYRKTLKQFGSGTIDIDSLIRQNTTWSHLSEQETLETYGDEIYLEIEENSGDVITKTENSVAAAVAGPIEAKNIKRIVLSSKY